jgi:8-oxo-dGTP diphosphatase
MEMITCTFENGNKDSLRHVVIGVIIIKDRKVLLAKRGTFQGKPVLESGKWALTGGFMDRDETGIQAAKREVKEELGIEITNLKLLHIVDNPYRRNDIDRQNINLVFIGDFAGGEIKTNEEVTEVKWFDLDNLPPIEEIAFDFYDELMFYKKYLKENFQIPVFD